MTDIRSVQGPGDSSFNFGSQNKVNIQGQTAYIDVVAMNGMDPKNVQAIIDDLHKNGITQINISFAKLSDETTWEAGGATTFQEVVSGAHQDGMKVTLAFGGALAGPDAWNLTNPTQTAAEVASFAKQYGIDGLDFDYEVTYQTGNEPNLLTFFQTLHKSLESANPPVPMTLTVMAAPSNSVGSSPGYTDGAINCLFQHFNDCFDGLNLMMYGGPQYLDTNPNYLQMWIGDKDGSVKNVASMYGISLNHVHIGFMDYQNQSSGGYPGDPSHHDGTNAADTYTRVLSNLGYSPSDLGNTFWWPNEGYNKDPSEGYLGIIETLSQELQDFNNELPPGARP